MSLDSHQNSCQEVANNNDKTLKITVTTLLVAAAANHQIVMMHTISRAVIEGGLLFYLKYTISD
jgi:hypothetical protein